MKKLAIVLPVVGAIFAFLWLHFVEPNRELCDKVCDITARISHENTPGDSTEDKKKQRGEFWTLSDRVKHAFPCSPGIPKAVSEFAGVLEYTADPDVTTAIPPVRPFGAAQADLLTAHDHIEAACKHATWTLWQ